MTGLMEERSCVNCKHDTKCNLKPDSFLYCFDKVGEPEVTGYIDNWYPEQVTDEEFVIWGYVYNDSKQWLFSNGTLNQLGQLVYNNVWGQRFQDGTFIHTSGIKNIKLYEGMLVKTRNSVYRLGNKRRKE